MVKQLPFRLYLVNEAPPENRCSHLRVEGDKVYCGKGYKGGEIVEQRELICDHFSLQLWCLDSERREKCNWYRGEPFEGERPR